MTHTPQAALTPPVAPRRAQHSTHHGERLQDDYAWLRAENWQQALRDPRQLPAEIADYLRAENAHCNTYLQDTTELQAELIDELKGRMHDEERGVPTRDEYYLYNWEYPEGAEHERLFRQLNEQAPRQCLLDANHEACKSEYFVLGDTIVSPDHAWLAWSADDQGAECYELRIRHINTQAELPERIADVGQAVWLDNQRLLYTQLDEQHRPNRVYCHRLGQSPEQDHLVYEEADAAYFVGLSRSRSGAYAFIHSSTDDTDEVWYLATDSTEAPEQAFRCLQPRQAGLEYSVEHQGERFLLLTNAQGATDFKIVETPVSRPSLEHWQDLIPHQAGRMLLSLDAFESHVVWLAREHALPSICYQFNHGETGHIAFEQAAYALGLDLSPDYRSQTLRFAYSSPAEPTAVYDFCLKTQTRVLKKQTTLPSGHCASDYCVERFSAISVDGTAVPVTVFYHRNTSLDAQAPCLVYGYGAYGSSVAAEFSSARLSLLDRGFVYALAHVRGGQECGRAWFEAAKLAGKPRSAQDFIAVTEYLVKRGYASPDKVACMGASAGGLLMGMVLNQAPELYKAVVADVPFVDVLNTMLDDSLPLTPGEWPQWGNPITDPEAYAWIRAYSPYDNVVDQAYPALLVTAGVSDPRVTYWEPAKWVAKLRAHQQSAAVILLHTSLQAGHFGVSGRYGGLADIARTYAFLIKELQGPSA